METAMGGLTMGRPWWWLVVLVVASVLIAVACKALGLPSILSAVGALLFGFGWAATVPRRKTVVIENKRIDVTTLKAEPARPQGVGLWKKYVWRNHCFACHCFVDDDAIQRHEQEHRRMKDQCYGRTDQEQRLLGQFIREEEHLAGVYGDQESTR